MAETKDINEMSFKEASVELEQTVRALETGNLELEEALERYDRGVQLLASLRERLAAAEQKVRVLLDATAQAAPLPDTQAAPATAFIDE